MFVEKFLELRERFKTYPSLRAFRELTKGEYEEEEVYRDNYYVHYRLRFRYLDEGVTEEYVMEYVDCFTACKVTNIQLFKGDELVFYSGEE